MTATSNVFADALFMIAKEEDRVDEFLGDLNLVKKVFGEEPDYLQFLSAPSIPMEERISALSEAFSGKVNNHILSFLQLLCEKAEIGGFEEIVKDFSLLCELSKKSITAVVKTAVPLDSIQEQNLINKLQNMYGKKVILEKIIDNSVLGGLTVDIEGTVLDGSIRQNLKQIRDVISV